MKKTSRLIAGLIIFTGTAFNAQAENLMDVYKLAQENDAQYQAAVSANLAVQEAGPQARSGLYPSVNFTAEFGKSRQEDKASPGNPVTYPDSQAYGIGLRQPIYRKDRGIEVKKADQSIQQSEADLKTSSQDLIVRTTEAYFNILNAFAEQDFARSEKSAISRQLEQAQKRFEVGMIAITDVHEAQAAFDLAQAEEIAADNLVANTKAQLREITGQYYSLQTLAVLDPQMPLLTPQPADLEHWAKVALEQNPTVLSAEQSAQIARQEIKLSRSGHLPTLDLTAAYSYQDKNLGGSFNIEQENLSAALELEIPIYTGGFVNSKTRQSRYLFEQSQKLLDQTRRSVIRQTSDAYRGVISGISRVKALKQAIVSTQSAMEATQAGFEVGTRTIVDVLLSQSNLFRAQRDYAQARHDYVINTLRLKQAAGTLSVEDVKDINQWLNIE